MRFPSSCGVCCTTRRHPSRMRSGQRKLSSSEVVFDKDLDSGSETGTCFDYISPAMLLGSDEDSLALAHAQMLIPYAYNATERASDDLTLKRRLNAAPPPRTLLLS